VPAKGVWAFDKDTTPARCTTIPARAGAAQIPEVGQRFSAQSRLVHGYEASPLAQLSTAKLPVLEKQRPRRVCRSA
jgi:hypothetical protein